MMPDGIIQESNLYDAEGNLIHTHDGTGKGVDIEYDIGGRRTKIMTKGKASQQYVYDAPGNITGITDGAGNHTEYILDKWGRIVEIRQADESSEFYGYDYAGNVIRSTDGEGNTTTYEYSNINQLAVLTDPQENRKPIIMMHKKGCVKELTAMEHRQDTPIISTIILQSVLQRKQTAQNFLTDMSTLQKDY